MVYIALYDIYVCYYIYILWSHLKKKLILATEEVIAATLKLFPLRWANVSHLLGPTTKLSSVISSHHLHVWVTGAIIQHPDVNKKS